ncbi:MAG: RHS repeat domain-containing protein, partial [Acutalibacteraceae bacterium]
MKNIKKAISVFLAVIMLLSTFSVSYSVFAQEITENETTDEEPEDFDELPEVLYEDASLRTEYSKTYILSDGSFRTKFFSYKVHTLNDDGTYTETSSGDSSSGRRRVRQIPVSGIGVNGTYVSSASQSSNFSDESFILLGSGNIGLIETSSFSDGYSEGYRISSAILTLSAQTEDVNAVVYAYDINEAFDVNNVTYSSKPSYSASPVDYSGVSEEGTISLDITQQLSEGSYGIALVSSDDISVEKQSMSGAVSVTYTITSGLNEEQEYAVFDIGSAGTAYVNKLTGNLVMTRDGISTGDGEHGFDLTSTYNSTIANNEISSWQTSATSGFASYSLFYDENGTCHYLAVSKENENDEYYSFTEENEFGFEKIKATAFKTITITVLVHTFSFEVPVAFEVVADEGKKIYQFDSSGIKSIQESEDNEDNENNTWKTVLCRTDNDDNTSDLIDGDGNKIHTNTTSSCITRTQILKDNTTGDAEIEYKDSEGNISSVEINDSVIATYTYDDNNRVTSVTNSKGYGLSFTYDGESKRIASVQEYKGASAGKKITYSRTFDTCTERTEGADGVFGNDDDLFTTYTFDNNCSLICAQNKAGGEELNSVSYKYENDIVSSAAFGGKISDNYLKNHNIESLANWTSIAKDDPDCQYTVAYSTEAQYVGEGSVKVTATDFTDNGLAGVYQAFNVNDSSLIRKGENYVVSGFIRTDGITRDNDTLSSRNYGAVIMLRIHYDDGTEAKRTYTESVRNTGEKWERVFASVKIPNNCDRLGVYLMIKNGTGTAYFDAVQLEKGTAPGEYNLLENNSFDYTENTTSNTGNTWVRSALTSTDAISDGKFRINASVTANKYFRQEINLVNASQSDKYILSAKVKASSASPTKSTFAMRARFYYADGTEKYITTKFSSYNDGVQFLQSGFDLSTTQTDAVPVKIRVSFLYYKNVNCAEVETMSLVRASDVYLFDNSEDDDIEDAGSYTYNENGDVLTYTDEEGNITTYTYDDSGELTEVETKDSDDNVIYSATYSNGNLISETENGVTTSYTYNENGDILTCTDGEGNITTYTYDDNGELTEVETKDGDDNVIYNATYSNGNLISETENGDTTSYTYDDNGNVSSVSKDGKTIGYL